MFINSNFITYFAYKINRSLICHLLNETSPIWLLSFVHDFQLRLFDNNQKEVLSNRQEQLSLDTSGMKQKWFS